MRFSEICHMAAAESDKRHRPLMVVLGQKDPKSLQSVVLIAVITKN
jgi:hypothetical protein